MAEILGLQIERLNHDCFKIKHHTKTVYIDPYKITDRDAQDKADIVFITHEHFDHCSPEDIKKVSTSETILMVNSNSVSKVSKLNVKNLIVASPGKNYNIKGVKVMVVPAYNTNKFRMKNQVFHPKEDEHCGYVFEIKSVKMYHAGDTDNIPEMETIGCDIAMLPVSGTYVMTPREAAEAVKRIKPKVAIPMHYGSIVGTNAHAHEFKDLVGDFCDVQII